jgi:hypothetical protein
MNKPYRRFDHLGIRPSIFWHPGGLVLLHLSSYWRNFFEVVHGAEYQAPEDSSCHLLSRMLLLP